ncbi:putative tail fiber protein [Pseudomonas phage vB_PF_Y1-MI]|nr:putative tail fiber protein [Pseudomonas phage vB_PF_Y1-MI]
MANIIKPSGVNQLWAAGGTKVDPGLIKSNIGWVVELPPYQYQNWLDNRQDTFIAHINQHGIPEWDSETEYQGNLSYTQGTDGMIYKCVSTNTNFNPVNPLNSTYWVRAFETYGSVAVVQNQLTQHLTNYATLAGITNPVLARNNLSLYSRAESDARFAAYSGNTSVKFNVGTATSNSHAVPLGQLSSLLLGATETRAGQIAIATVGEVETGTNDTKAVTPSKGNAVYLKKSGNLAGISNVATARANLGLSDIVTMSSNTFLKVSDNLADIPNKPVARNNLGLGDISTRSIASFLQTSNNLLDVPNKGAARNNLGLSDMATVVPELVMFKGENLAGMSDVPLARRNLGLGSIATQQSDTYMAKSENLAGLSNVQAARNNLGLGGAATREVFGVAGNFNFTSSQSLTGYTYLGNNITLQWGRGPALGDDGQVVVALVIPGTILSVQVTGMGVPDVGIGPGFLTDSWANSSFRVSNNYNSGAARAFSWTAIVAV